MTFARLAGAVLALTLLLSPVTALAGTHVNAFVGANLIVLASKHPSVGFGLETSTMVMPFYAKLYQADGGVTILGPEAGAYAEAGWIIKHGGFLSVGGSAGAVVPMSALDGPGYAVVGEADVLVGYQWAKDGGVRAGVKLSGTRPGTWVLGSLEVTSCHKEVAVAVGPRLPLVPAGVDNLLSTTGPR